MGNEARSETSNLASRPDRTADAHYPYLVDACIIRDFLEWEILVDVLGYTLTPGSSAGELVLSCPDLRFAQSLRLGYIQTEIQTQLAVQRARIESTASIQQAGQEFYRRFGHDLVKRVDDPTPRFTYTVPHVPEFTALFAGDALFREELFVLSSATKEHFAPFDTIRGFRIYKEVTVLDLIKLQRLAHFLRLFAGTHLLEVATADRPLVFQSLIPRFTVGTFVASLAHIIPDERAEQLIEFLSWQLDSGRVFDIQYQPLIRTGQMLTVPMNMLGISNIIRNSLQFSHERIHGHTASDPLVPILAQALTDRSWPVRPKVGYKFAGIAGEVDVLVSRGRYVFAFECKNSLHPCNLYEIRTSFDHLHKNGCRTAEPPREPLGTP